jgi:hypothetical protein
MVVGVQKTERRADEAANKKNSAHGSAKKIIAVLVAGGRVHLQ